MLHQKETPAIAVAGAEEIPYLSAYFIGNQTGLVTNKPPVFWATRYACHGFSVLPLYWIDAGRCSCGSSECKSPGKHPISEIAPHGVHSATQSLRTIGSWFLKYPAANIGIAIPEGLVAFDVDPRNGGSTDSLPDSWQGTLHAKTGGGGWHVLYRLPQGRKARSLGRGIDVKASGGYLAVEPSMHASGRAYEWQDWSPLDDDEPIILELPESFLEPLKAASARVVATPAPEAGWSASEAFLGLSGGRQKLIAEGVPEGGRSDAFHGLACGLADDGFSPEQIEAILSLHPSGIGHKYSGRLGAEIARCLNKRTVPEQVGAAGDGLLETGEIVQPTQQTQKSGASLVVVRGDTVKVEDIDWAWKGFFAHGSLHLKAGRPESGKTTTTISLGATWSSAGKWPDGTACEGGHVVMWTGEDQIASVVTPRFIAAGADMTRVHFITARKNHDGTTAPFDPAKDMGMVGKVINDLGGHVFLILDPIISAVAGNSDKANEVRRALQPLVDLLARTRSVGVGITHVNKDSVGRNLLERVLGSQAFAALARLAFMSASDYETGQRIMVRAKSNIGQSGGGFPYRIVPKPVQGLKDLVPTVEWGEYTPGDPLTLLAGVEGPDNAEERTTLQDCCDFIVELLDANGATRSTEMEKAVTAAKFSKSSLRKARERLSQGKKIHVTKSGFDGGWVWYPGEAPKMTVPPFKRASS